MSARTDLGTKEKLCAAHVEAASSEEVAALAEELDERFEALLDRIARHTEEGHAFRRRAMEAGFKQAARERDEPFGDFGLAPFKTNR